MLIDDILKVLPQRYPFVMIDRVVELEPGRKVVAVKNVSNNEAYFPGHFPKNPVMPGVLMLEAAAQACIVLFCAGKPCGREKEREFYLGGVKVRFLSPVVPGDQLVITAEPVKVIANAGIMKVRGQANGREVFEGEMSFAAKS